MVEYECDKCGKIFMNKTDRDRHCAMKYPCVKTNKCNTCGKYFTHRSALYRHIKKCKGNIAVKTTNTIIDNRTNTINNLNVAKVNVVKFGSENISYISDDIYKQILGRGIRAIEEFIEYSHFDRTHPKNHNIYITNIRNEYLVLYDGDKWTITRRDEKLEDIIYAKSDFLCRKFEELSESMHPNDVFKFKKYLAVKDDQVTINRIKDDLSIKLYNNRHIPMELRKQMDLENSMYIKKCADIAVINDLHDIGCIAELLKDIPRDKIKIVEEAIKAIYKS